MEQELKKSLDKIGGYLVLLRKVLGTLEKKLHKTPDRKMEMSEIKSNENLSND